MVTRGDQGTSVRQSIPYGLDASVTQGSSAWKSLLFPWLSELKVIVQFEICLWHVELDVTNSVLCVPTEV